MLIRYHEPYGTVRLDLKMRHTLPKNWKALESRAKEMPKKFDVIDQGKLYRSGIVWPKHVKSLQEKHGVVHFISLIDGAWLREFYEVDGVYIHQFPFIERAELTPPRVKNIVDVIDSLEEPALVFCLKGATKTGMVCAGYQISHRLRTPEECVRESRWRDLAVLNPHIKRDILEIGTYYEQFLKK